jgi:hypothetical protein
MGGEKLSLILSLAKTLKLEDALKAPSIKKKNYNSEEGLDELISILPSIVRPALWKQGKKELGFSTLHTDGEGNYWVRCSRGFHTSQNESLASVETLIDELGDEIDREKKNVINKTYRRLSENL